MKDNYNDIVRTLPHMEGEICSTGPSLQEAVTHIENMDLSFITKKLCSGGKLISRLWDATECEIAIQYYKNFLFLNKKYLSEYPVIPPSLEIDEIWHQHILDTRAYAADSKRIFGFYFHHNPNFGTRSDKDFINLNTAFEVTQKLHELEFGAKILSIWGEANE